MEKRQKTLLERNQREKGKLQREQRIRRKTSNSSFIRERSPPYRTIKFVNLGKTYIFKTYKHPELVNMAWEEFVSICRWRYYLTKQNKDTKERFNIPKSQTDATAPLSDGFV